MADSTRPILDTITDQEKADGKIMAILSYLWILFLIPLITSKDNKFVMFHVEQGIVLFIISVVAGVVSVIIDGVIGHIIGFTFCGGGIIYLVVRLLVLILIIMGVLNAAQGKVAKLPVVGDFGSKFNLVK